MLKIQKFVVNMNVSKNTSTDDFATHEQLLEDTFRWGQVRFFAPYTELTSKPELKVAIITCIDCRILTASFGIDHPGKAVIIRTAGALMTSDTIRNLLISIYKLGVTLVAVVGHTDCGGEMNKEKMNQLLETIANTTGKATNEILRILNRKSSSEVFLGFENVEDQVRDTVENIARHPLIPDYVDVQGYLYDTKSCKITRLTK